MPARKPTALKILNGSADHHPERANPDEPAPQVITVLPPPPAWLAPEAAPFWWDLGRGAMALNVMTVPDLYALALTAQAFVELQEAQGWQSRSDAWKRAMAGLARFGLTPADRSKLHAAPPAKASPIAGLEAPLVKRA